MRTLPREYVEAAAAVLVQDDDLAWNAWGDFDLCFEERAFLAILFSAQDTTGEDRMRTEDLETFASPMPRSKVRDLVDSLARMGRVTVDEWGVLHPVRLPVEGA